MAIHIMLGILSIWVCFTFHIEVPPPPQVQAGGGGQLDSFRNCLLVGRQQGVHK